MFWSGNYIAVRELNFLLKEENVSLSQVLEADDILQECKADNKALIQFLTKPEVLAELITLITEEPPKNVELASQYRHASIACEVLTSHLSSLADRLSLDTVQMNRLCDFINREPPLNPLLASYFSKTVEMLLERSPKQDWYLYHIVCLRVLDFFRSRRDFLPNLLRHLHTSAIADTFKHLLRLDDLFNKIVMEWLDEHQFLESLIQIICGSYVPEPIRPHPATAPPPDAAPAVPDAAKPEKAEAELAEKPELNHKEETTAHTDDIPVENSTAEAVDKPASDTDGGGETTHNSTDCYSDTIHNTDTAKAAMCSRWRAVAAANAAALLTDLILNGGAGEGCTTRLRTVWVLVSRLQSEEWVRSLLAGMFTSPPAARAQAVVHGAQVLLALLSTDPILPGTCGGGGGSERSSVELAVAPHLPLLHQALLQPPADDCDHATYNAHLQEGGTECKPRPRVGVARVHVAALIAQLALSEVEDVPTTIITLGTPGTLVELMFQHPDNNFLHAQVYALIKHALANRAYRTHYANHLLIECDLLTRLMDAYEENENKRAGVPRAGYMGHVILALRRVWRALDEQDGELLAQLRPRLAPPLLQRWDCFQQNKLRPLIQQHDTPLGGYYPSENIYEVENMAELADPIEATYEFNDMSCSGMDELGDDINVDSHAEFGSGANEDSTGQQGEAEANKSAFLQLANQRFGADMWDDCPDEDADEGRPGEGEGLDDMFPAPAHAVQDVLSAVAPWETNTGGDTNAADDDWAQFSAAPAPPPVDPFAPILQPDQGLNPGLSQLEQEFSPFWPADTDDIPDDIMRLSQFSISDTFPQHLDKGISIVNDCSQSQHHNTTIQYTELQLNNTDDEKLKSKLDADNDNVGGTTADTQSATHTCDTTTTSGVTEHTTSDS